MFPPDRLHDGLARADVVVLAAPHTSETTHMIDCAALASMKTGSLLINVARGKLVDHAALAASRQFATEAVAALAEPAQ